MMREEKSEGPGDEPDALHADQERSSLACPRCGSRRVRRRATPFLINLVACVISVVLAPSLCVTAPILLVSLLALPVTMCLALVGCNRCRDCRHRFVPGDGDAGSTVPRFPWWPHALNILLLVLLCLVGPYVMRVAGGGGKRPDVMTDMSLLLILGMLLWGSLIYHLVLHHWLRRRVAHPLIWAVLFLLPAVLGGGEIFYNSLPRFHVRALLALAELAPLPRSATGVRVYTWSSPFSGEDFLRFTAEPNDIERFLAESPALKGQEPTRYSSQRMRLLTPRDFSGAYPEKGVEYVTPHPGFPSWYKQEIRGPARKYLVQPPRYQLPGEVLVDEETSTVYVYLCFS